MVATLCAAAQAGPRPGAAEELFALANQSRAQAGLEPLRWDRTLADAAMRHCERMAQEGPISHRYGGEPDLTERVAATGSHFSLIEENIAVGSYAAQIHEGWMNSPGHRRNLLAPEVDRVGIAVIETRGALYAVADYARGVQVLTAPQLEAKIIELVRMSGIAVRRDPHDARLACMLDRGFPAGMTGGQPLFVMRWQGADTEHLPQGLVNRLGSGQYQAADVGACEARGEERGFTAYRLAVLLY
jgi:Cysteine-rich secretory protein family